MRRKISEYYAAINHFDTLVVTEKRNGYTECNMLETGGTRFHLMGVELTPRICPNSNYCIISINITKEKQQTVALPFIRAFGLEYSPHIQNDQLTTTSMTLTTSHKSYDSCYNWRKLSAAVEAYT